MSTNYLPPTRRLPTPPKNIVGVPAYLLLLVNELEKMYREIMNVMNVNRDGRNDV